MEFPPTGFIKLLEARMMIWRALHGDSMNESPPSSHEGKRDGKAVIVRTPAAAERHYEIGRQQVAEAAKCLHKALAEGKVRAELKDHTIPQDYWRYDVSSMTISTGLLECQGLHMAPEMHLQECYIPLVPFEEWLRSAIGTAGSPQEPDSRPENTHPRNAQQPTTPPKRRGGPKPGPYIATLKSYLELLDGNLDGGLESLTLKDLSDRARKRLNNGTVSGVPKSRTGLEEPIKRIIKQIADEKQNSR
jgi:hypothetical protein